MEVKDFQISSAFSHCFSVEAPDIVWPLDQETQRSRKRGQLGVVPERIVTPSPRQGRGWVALALTGAIGTNAGFAAFFLLLSGRHDFVAKPETATPVEVVASMPEVSKQTLPEPAVPLPMPPPPSPPPAQSPPPPEPAEPSPPQAKVAPPALVAPPPEAMRAETQLARPERPAPAPEPTPAPAASETDKAPPPAAEAVLTASQGTFAVDPAAPAPPTPTSRIRGTKTKVDASAVLARALPMDLSGVPSTFRAILSGQGNQVGEEYKGLVYGRLQRSNRAVEAARVRHLIGRVIVSFSVDDGGRAAGLAVAQSSGRPEVDAIGLAMVREAEPFPPPPPGPKPVFAPVLIVGDE